MGFITRQLSTLQSKLREKLNSAKIEVRSSWVVHSKLQKRQLEVGKNLAKVSERLHYTNSILNSMPVSLSTFLAVFARSVQRLILLPPRAPG